MSPLDTHAHAHAHAHARVALPFSSPLQLPLPLPLLSLLVSHYIASLKLKLPQPLSRPLPCPPRSVEQLSNVRFGFEKCKTNTAKLTVVPLTIISRLPLWDLYHLFFVVIARGTMMLDLRKGKHKQITIKLYLRFVSPTLLVRDRDPLSVRRIRRTKYSVSTGMVHVHTKLINYYYYSPLSPPPLPISV